MDEKMAPYIMLIQLGGMSYRIFSICQTTLSLSFWCNLEVLKHIRGVFTMENENEATMCLTYSKKKPDTSTCLHLPM